jgi:hypothetical protein
MNSHDTWYASLDRRAMCADKGAEPERRLRTPRAQKRVRAQQAELYVEALGLKGACKAMGLGPWQIHSLRRWLRGGQPVPHNRGNHAKFKLSAQDRADILAMKGQEKSAYPAALYNVHPSTVRRIWNGWEPRA